MKIKLLILSFIALPALSISSLSQSTKTDPLYAKLRPSSNYWDRDARHVPVRISRLSRNRKLAAVGDTLYMLDAQNQIVWTWSAQGPRLTDLPVMDSKRTIYVIGDDLLWVALDSATGKEKWRGSANGRASYTQIKLYQKDMYLVVTYMMAYRENGGDKTLQDQLTLCRGNDILWNTYIPPDATIRVQGANVWAINKRKNRTIKRKIVIPRHLGRSIGKVSPEDRE